MAGSPESTDDRAMTWAALLAHWTDFARSAVALPATPDGERWKRTIAPIIGLQAVTHALAEVGRLAPEERPLAIDRAESLVERHDQELRHAWAAEPLDDRLASIIDDARSALAAAAEWGVEWTAGPEGLVADHPGEVVAELLSEGFRGSLLAPTPGVALPAGAPVAFLGAPRAGPIDPEWVAAVEAYLGDGVSAASRAGPRQVYRQFDFGRGGPVRDLAMPVRAGAAPGQPLLLWAIRDGQAQPAPLPPRRPEPAPEIPLMFAESLGDIDSAPAG